MKLGKKRKFIFGSGRYTEVKNEAADMMDTEAAEELGSGDGMTEDGVSSGEEAEHGERPEETGERFFFGEKAEPGEESAQGTSDAGGPELQEALEEEVAAELYPLGWTGPQEDNKEEFEAEPYSEGGTEPQESAGEEIGKTDDGMISAKEAEPGEESAQDT